MLMHPLGHTYAGTARAYGPPGGGGRGQKRIVKEGKEVRRSAPRCLAFVDEVSTSILSAQGDSRAGIGIVERRIDLQATSEVPFWRP